MLSLSLSLSLARPVLLHSNIVDFCADFELFASCPDTRSRV
jgi:hypothetical protein